MLSSSSLLHHLLLLLSLWECTMAQSARCIAVSKTCENKLNALDQASAMANMMTFCPFLKSIFHDPTEGCMGSPDAQCCCCEKDTFVNPLNTMMKETKELEMVFGLNAGCAAAPLQCDPNIDCEGRRV